MMAPRAIERVFPTAEILMNVPQRPIIGNVSAIGKADTIIGNQRQGAIAAIDERNTRLRLAAPLSAKRSKETAEAILSLLEPIKEFVKTIPFGDGKEFFPREKIA
jgi:IS30 family transposase